jgi:hypothetical protein
VPLFISRSLKKVPNNQVIPASLGNPEDREILWIPDNDIGNDEMVPEQTFQRNFKCLWLGLTVSERVH